MAKLFLIIICVCTACIHLAWAQSRKGSGSESISMQTHRQHEGHSSSDLNYKYQVNPIDNSHYENDLVHRTKRHAGHSHANTADKFVEMNPNTNAFIEKLFIEFTNGDRESMNLIQFENMMKTLKLDRFIEDNQLQQQQQHQLSHQQHSSSVEKSSNSDENHHHHAHSNETVSYTYIHSRFNFNKRQ